MPANDLHSKPEETSGSDPALNPKRHFKSPELLIANDDLSDREKYDLLREWDLEMTNRLKAEEEGMSAENPAGNRFEAKLADEAARVKTSLTELALKLGDD